MPEPTGAPAVVPRLVLDEHQMAEALGLSVHTLRKDRGTARRIPFYKIGSAIRYDVNRVREALAMLEEGGTQRRAKGQR